MILRAKTLFMVIPMRELILLLVFWHPCQMSCQVLNELYIMDSVPAVLLKIKRNT